MNNIIEKQREFFENGKTLNLETRKENLLKLKKNILLNQSLLEEALKKDLNKSPIESYITEISLVISEINHTLKNLKKWAKPKRVHSTMNVAPSKSIIHKNPFGICLILAPWNYPFQLSFMPLIGAIAAGNTVILKSSKSTPNVTKIIAKIINETFECEYVYPVPIDAEYNEILNHKYDFIFFTGSANIGKVIAKKAAENLTPTVLELGGKSPCILMEDANIKIAAKRIVFAKMLNSGQTCVAPDYFLVHKNIKEEFIKEVSLQLNIMYGLNIVENEEIVKIINKKHFLRLTKLIDNHKEKSNVIGGERNEKTNKIAPAIFTETKWDDEIMKEEIFGPIIPIIEFDDFKEIREKIIKRPRPLALYVFSNNKKQARKNMQSIEFGSGCINDAVVQISNHNLPFGGIGNSGIGDYHGVHSFNTFTHKCSIIESSNIIDLPLRYSPISKKKAKFLRFLV